MPMVSPGTCQYCSCTEDRPCPLHTGETCCWMDRTRTWCSNPACQRRHHARLRAIRDYSRRMNAERRAQKQTRRGRRKGKRKTA